MNRFAFATYLAFGTLCGLPVFGEDSKEGQSRIGGKIVDFSLQDYRGKKHSLSDYQDAKFVVIVFLGTECPLAKLYAPRLAALNAKHQNKDVVILGINSNRQDSITEIAAYARKHKITFPILKDSGNKVADQLKAVRTPEVFVLDEKRVVQYHGRIDDQYGVGYIRNDPRRNDLALALDQLLAGKPVAMQETKAVGCFIGRIRTPNADAKVTYSNQVARILQKRCVECHREGEIAPFALTKYEEVVGWAETIEEVIADRRMPPWHADPKHGSFANDRNMTSEEKELISKWVAEGAPQGDPHNLPKPRTFVEGWQLPRKPDLVVHMREEPYTVQAEGVVRYQYMSVDPGFKEDKWVRMAQPLPGNRAVVHHILVFVRPKGDRKFGDGGGKFLAAYVPGMRARDYGPGRAKLIPAGSQLVFQMHYTPIGTEQTDRSKIGFIFSDPKEVTHMVVTENVVQHRFVIPPKASNHEVIASPRTMAKDAQLLAFLPHMHLRGKSFRYEAHFPDGKQEILLSVPHYDFNWQTNYIMKEARKLPKGTKIHGVAHFDNSENNLANPNPNDSVRWGDQTWNEMMIGYFDIALPRDSLPKLNLEVQGLLDRFDKNKNGKISRDEVPGRLKKIFDRLDTNSDDQISTEELVKGFGN